MQPAWVVVTAMALSRVVLQALNMASPVGVGAFAPMALATNVATALLPHVYVFSSLAADAKSWVRVSMDGH